MAPVLAVTLGLDPRVHVATATRLPRVDRHGLAAAEVDTLSVQVNNTSDGTNTVLDFSGTNSHDVATGPAPAPLVTLDMDGAEGVLIAVMSNLTLDVFGFVTLNGSFTFKKASGTFYDNAGAEITGDYISVGAFVTTATVSAGGVGLQLNNVSLGMLLLSYDGGTAGDLIARETGTIVVSMKDASEAEPLLRMAELVAGARDAVVGLGNRVAIAD